MTRPPILMSMTRPGTAPSQRKRSFTAIWSPGRSKINGVKYSDIDYINRILKVKRQVGRDVYADNREIIANGVPEIEEYMNMVFPDMEENELFKNELLEIVVDVTGFLPETA